MTCQGQMDGLRYALLHNSWATRRLIDACHGLTPEQLEATAPGAAGSVLRSLKHIVGTEGHRLRRLLTGSPPEWKWATKPLVSTRSRRGRSTTSAFGATTPRPIDAERPVKVDWQGGMYDVTTGVILAQVIHHGNSHREQVCTILTVLGIEPPDLSGGGFEGAHGHVVEASSSAGQ